MIRPCPIAAALLLFSTSALATVGGPNSFQPLGVDETGKVFLRENVGGESGEFKLWILDPAKPTQPTIKPMEYNAPAPAGLKPLVQLPLNELVLASGEIVRQSLYPREDVLLHKFDLRVTVGWKTARSTVDLVAYKNAQVRMADGYSVPKSSCAVAFVSTLGKPEETGYELQRPVMLCARKSDLAVPVKPAKPTKQLLRTP